MGLCSPSRPSSASDWGIEPSCLPPCWFSEGGKRPHELAQLRGLGSHGAECPGVLVWCASAREGDPSTRDSRDGAQAEWRPLSLLSTPVSPSRHWAPPRGSSSCDGPGTWTPGVCPLPAPGPMWAAHTRRALEPLGAPFQGTPLAPELREASRPPTRGCPGQGAEGAGRGPLSAGPQPWRSLHA